MSTKRQDEIEESDVRILSKALIRQGVSVRREKLSRGREFRVKSGTCQAFGSSMLFVDRNLPIAQQSAVILDFCIENGVPVAERDVKNISPSKREILTPLIALAALRTVSVTSQ